MTRDDVIRMAREAGVFFSVPDVCPAEPLEHHVQAVQRFAALVAAHEREQCAKVCDELQEHFAAYKDTALLNGDVELANAASGEPRAARAIADLIRSRR